jgi:hypothetical protein
VERFAPVSYSHIGYDFEDEIEFSHAALARFEERARNLKLKADTASVGADE